MNGESVRSVPAGSTAITVLEDLRISTPGIYRFEIRGEGSGVVGRSNPVVVRSAPSRRIFWGDGHGHSGRGAGRGSAESFYRFGRDTARLDWTSLTERGEILDDAVWTAVGAATQAFRVPGQFTTLLGYEWAADNPEGGHHTVYLGPSTGDRFAEQHVLRQADLYSALSSAFGASSLAIPQAHQASDWTAHAPEIVPLVEIHSGHGTFEYFGQNYLEAGAEVGFVASSATEGAHPGYSLDPGRQLGGLTAAVAGENTAAAILEALKSRATYATTGERIVLETSLNEARMGSRVAAAGDRRIEGTVHGTAPIDTVEILKNGEIVHHERFLETRLRPRTTVQLKFESSSAAPGHANPRPARYWRGTIEIRGATLEGIEKPWFHNPASFVATVREGKPLTIEFMVHTRGRGKALLLALAGADRSTEIEVSWEQTAESIPNRGTTRETTSRDPARPPAETVVFRLGDLVDGLARHEIAAPGTLDAIQVQLVADDAELDAGFEFVDSTPPAAGDYYYVRVTQVDGSMAWSSPWRLTAAP